MRLFTYPWDFLNLAQCFSALADIPYSLFFDSARPNHSLSRYSYLCWHPDEIIESKDGNTRVTQIGESFTSQESPFDIVQERLDKHKERIGDHKHNYPFIGGAAGYFGYDLARDCEKLPSIARRSETLPDMAIGLYTQLIALDHKTQKACLLIYAPDERQALIKKTWIERQVTNDDTSTPFEGCNISWHAERSKEQYIIDIQNVIQAIHDGEIFQANISRRFEALIPENFDFYAHYKHLRQVNPAPFCSYMNFGNVKIASTSPERFLHLKEHHVETRPIKGTRPLSQDPEVLLSSEKDRAENAMIVDLLRNDLSKVCEDHSVNVLELCSLESFENLHHLVSIVDGTLRANCTPLDLLKNCFPGGSITGAPKVRAMEIIESLEPDRRGPYSGAIGYISFDGTMDTSIAIRTLVYDDKIVSLQTGGGITAHSDPEAEYQETLDKAEKIIESFQEPDKNKRRAQ